MQSIKIEIKWALLFMLATLAWMIIERLIGLHDRYIAEHTVYTSFFILVAVLIYVLALLDKRKTSYQGLISYNQVLKSGLILTLFIALLSPLSQYLTHTFITPDYFANIADYAVSIDKMTAAEASAYFSLKNYIFLSMVMTAVMGLIITLIISLIVWIRR